MSTPTPRALLALREAHNVIASAVLSAPTPPGPLPEAAVAVGEALDALEGREDDAIEAAAEVLRGLWPHGRTCAALHRAVRAGAITTSEIAAWVAAQGRSGQEAESALAALLDVVQAGESALALEDEQECAEGGERG